MADAMASVQPSSSSLRRRLPLVPALAALALAACSDSEPKDGEPDDSTIPDLPVPAADGPKLVVVRHGAVVRDRPSMAGQILGTLRAGAEPARAEQPYSTKGCPGGWYPIRPRGFVCAGEDATVDPSHAAWQLLNVGPKLDRPLPYRYGRVARQAAVVYGRLPTPEEQQQAEPKIGGKQRSSMLGAGANDVPLDERGMASGPPVLVPGAEGVGEDGYRKSDHWLRVEGDGDSGASLLQAGLTIDPSSPPTRVLKRRSGVAMLRTFEVGEGGDARTFALLADGRFMPTDRLMPVLGPVSHGIDLDNDALPVAFALRRGVTTYSMEEKGKATATDEELEPREHILLTGRFRTVAGVKYFATRDDHWVRHRDIIYVPKRHEFPDFATEDQKWLDISLANQTLVAWHGRKAVYATLISSGQDRIGDPKEGPATIQGVFRVGAKHVTRALDEREVGQAFSVLEAPWVMEFAEGFALTGCYWHASFGEARSYHDIALSPIDARMLWMWTGPALPEGWHSVTVGEAEPTTIVYVHK
jgi:hypothetical protein